MFDLFGGGQTATTQRQAQPQTSGSFDLFGGGQTAQATQTAPAQIRGPATHEWNGMQIPANIPTQNLVNYDPLTGNKSFKLPDWQGGGVYTEDSQGNIVKGGHTTYGGVQPQPGMQRDDIIPQGLGGTNANAGNINMVPLGTAKKQDQVETSLSRQVKEKLVQPKAAITQALAQKRQIAEQPGFFGKIKSAAEDVGNAVQQLTPSNIAKNAINLFTPKPTSGPMVFPVKGNEGTNAVAQANLRTSNYQSPLPQFKPSNELSTFKSATGQEQPSQANLVPTPKDIVQFTTRAVAALTISAYQMFQNDAENKLNIQNSLTGQKQIPHAEAPKSVEPVGMSPLAQELLGTDTIKDLPGQAAELEQQLNSQGITGNTAAILASLGVSANTVMALYPLAGDFLGKAANDAVADLAKTFTKDTGVRITTKEMYEISRGDPGNVVPTVTKEAWQKYVNKSAGLKLAQQSPSKSIPLESSPIGEFLQKASSKDIFGGKDYVPNKVEVKPFSHEINYGAVEEAPKPPEVAPFSHETSLQPQNQPFAHEILPVTPKTAPETAITPKAEVAPTVVSKPAVEGQTPSKIARSIEQKAVEQKLTQGFEGVAGYDKITIKDQAERATQVMSDPQKAIRIIKGEIPLPEGLRGTALITAAENYAIKNGDTRMIYELANSPLISETSAAAQELRLAAERQPDNLTAKLQEIKRAKEKALQKKVGKLPKAKEQAKAEIKAEIMKKIPKIKDWTEFIDSIKCT